MLKRFVFDFDNTYVVLEHRLTAILLKHEIISTDEFETDILRGTYGLTIHDLILWWVSENIYSCYGLRPYYYLSQYKPVPEFLQCRLLNGLKTLEPFFYDYLSHTLRYRGEWRSAEIHVTRFTFELTLRTS